MIIPIDEQLSKKLSVDFDLYPVRSYNDYAFDLSNNNSLITQICHMAYNDPERFARLKELLKDYESQGDSDQYLAAMGYCRYAERDFDDSIKYISTLLENSPGNIDVWIDMCYLLAQIADGYHMSMNLRFHLYHFINAYHQYDFHTVNKQSMVILDRLVRDIARTPAVRSGYHKKPAFETEYLILNGACNNYCEICHVPVPLREYDFADRLIKNGVLELSKYIFFKVRKKCIKHFVVKGGEPTLHPDYLKIIKVVSAVRPDVLIHVRTNARTFCNSAFLRKHPAAGVSNIIFEASLFSHDPGVHDAIARVQNSHEQTLRGLRNILEAGFRASVRVVLCDKNIQDLPRTLDFILEQFSGPQGIEEIGVYLPPPSADNLDTYYPEGVQRLRDQAVEAIGARESGACRIALMNQALAADS